MRGNTMHKHPTPLVIKAEIFKELVRLATENNMLSTDVSIAMEAIENGIKIANTQHDELKGALSQ